ncbi:hypothetical protein J45TS6_36110 [Paenibacillus sp. J45TS6]|uniref:hypothetical protein n=1 Tax=Paenibacillus sp. J45TS6 TaxID=2807196 RepID=UPI001B1EF01A|nr:hypothetical protein [Paenibacillus sp. J45TS6]GIP45152.1 hypothetical protein J45TS6_36110 [Paenibacillus sp. J45TS6]
MSIIESTQEKIVELERALEQFSLIKDTLPLDVRFTTQRLIDNQLNELKYRLEKLTFLRSDKKCTVCDHWIRENEDPIHLFYQYNNSVEPANVTVCPSCIGAMKKVMTTNEAEKLWGLIPGTIKQDRRLGNLQEFEEVGLVYHTGRYIKIHEIVMRSYYEPKIQERQRKEKRKIKDSQKSSK